MKSRQEAQQSRRDWVLLVMCLSTLGKARGIYYGLIILVTIVIPNYWPVIAGGLFFVWCVWFIDNSDDSDIAAAIGHYRERK